MNVELAMDALADAKANPEQFDMENFFSSISPIHKKTDGFQLPPCGTTACYAGFVSLRVAPKGTKILDGYVYEPGVSPLDRIHAEFYAAKALGITEQQADLLFYVDNIAEVELVLDYLTDSPDASPAALGQVVLDAR